MAAEEVEDEPNEETAATSTKKLSHKQFRRLIKKEKRRLRRQEAAKQREEEEEHENWRIENDPVLRARLEFQEKKQEERLNKEEQERTKQQQLWLEREVLAQEQFKRKREDEERKAHDKLEQEKRIKKEWEEQQRKDREVGERKQQAIKEKEDVLFRELDKPADTTKGSAWHNPIAPRVSSQNYGTEKDRVNCSFYLKTGACRFAERCSRHHPRPPSSVTLLVPAMFQDVRLTQSMLDEADHDAGLEYDEHETKEKFKEFFEDALEEFKKAGTVVQFKACCNHEPHLRGNVYVQYKSEEGCEKAFMMFNGRWFAGRQLSCEYSPVTKWKSAICGLYEKGSCPRGRNCNFLHVYQNPGDAFRHMDRDISPGSLESDRHRRDRTEDRFGRHRDWNEHRDRSHGRGYSRTRDRDRDESHDRDRERSRHRRERERTRDRDDYREKDRCDRRGRSQDERTRSDSRHRRERAHERSHEKDEQANRQSGVETQTHDRLGHHDVTEEDNNNSRIKESTEGDHSPAHNQSRKRKHHSPKQQKSAKKKHKHHKKHKHKKHSSSGSSVEEDGVNGKS